MIIITRKCPIDSTIKRRSTPIASFNIFAVKHPVRAVGDHLYQGSVDIPSATLQGAESYSIERGRVKIYSDGSGSHHIPPEWRDHGITVVGDVYNNSGVNNYSFFLRER